MNSKRVSKKRNLCAKPSRVTTLLFGLAVVMLIGCSQGSAPQKTEASDRAVIAYKAMADLDWQAVAGMLNSSALADFHNMVFPILEANVPGADSASDADSVNMFGTNYQYNRLKNASNEEFFFLILKSAFDNNSQLRQTFASIRNELVGELVDDKGVIHVLSRTSLVIGSDINEMSVLSFEKEGDEYKMLMPPRIKGLAQLIAQALSSYRP